MDTNTTPEQAPPWPLGGDPPQRMGIMGGTLNPVHLGHLIIAEQALHSFHLDRVVWIPAGDPPHKGDEELVQQEDRYAMTLLATGGNPGFQVSRLEMERKGPSYSLETIRYFRQWLDREDLFFITGADTILDLLTWYRHEEVIRSCRFIAASRPGHDLGRLRSILPLEYLERVDEMPVTGVDVSSTEIRRRMRAGNTVRYLIPEAVESYIRRQGLYGACPERDQPADTETSPGSAAFQPG